MEISLCTDEYFGLPLISVVGAGAFFWLLRSLKVDSMRVNLFSVLGLRSGKVTLMSLSLKVPLSLGTMKVLFMNVRFMCCSYKDSLNFFRWTGEDACFRTCNILEDLLC